MNGGAAASRRVHPGTVGIRFLKDLPQSLIGLPALLALMSDVGWETIILLALLAALVLGLTQWLAWSRFRYGLHEGELLIESGLFSRNRRSIPFERIQDLEVEQGPLHRLFGLAKVRVETGAGGKDEGLLDSITLDEADRLRNAIRAGRDTPAEAAELVPQPEARTLLAMSPVRVLASGLFNFSLFWVAGLFGLLQAFEPLIPFDIYDPGRWLGLVDRGSERFTAGAVIAVLLVALGLGVVTGLIATLGRDWGFRLVAEGKRLRRKNGLFTKREIVIPKRRVQLALRRTGPLRQLLGFSELALQTLGSSQGQGGLQNVAPFVRAPEIDRVLAEFPGLQSDGDVVLRPVSSRHVLRTAIQTLAVPVLAIALAAAWRPEALGLLPVLPVLLAGAVLRRRFHRYALAGNLLLVEAGFWRRRFWAVPLANAQSVTLSRSWLQRRLGLATLAIDTAGAPIFGGPRIVDIRTEQARGLRDSIIAAGCLRG